MSTTAHADYQSVYQRSVTEPDQFWLEAAEAVAWSSAPTVAVDDSAAPLYRWFPDGELNITVSALDRHVEAGRGEHTALIYDSPVTGTQQRFTYAELTKEVSHTAGILKALGVSAGDRVLIYLPMIPQAPIAMLACARLGAVHSVVFGGFAAKEIASRIDDAAPDVILTATGGVEPTKTIPYVPKVAEAVELAEHQVKHVVVWHRPEFEEREGTGEGFTETRTVPGEARISSGAEMTAEQQASSESARWHSWQDLRHQASYVEAVPVPATAPLYVLYTSGTTGKPKGVVRDQGGTAVALQWSIGAVFDVGPEDTMLTASDVGWVVGHSYIVYAPLLAGATTVLYEGKPVGTPDAGAFWRLIQEHQVTTMFTAPTALRAVRRQDPDLNLLDREQISSLKALFVAGERLDPQTQRWISEGLQVPVIDNWWQTETGWPIAANPIGIETFPIKEGSAALPMAGYQVGVLGADGEELSAGEHGNIVIRLPLPPGTLTTLWGDDQRYIDSYLSTFEGYYTTGDSGYLDDEGYLFVMGRTDDVINVSGHRLSTGSMEAAVARHPQVAECAVVGLSDELKGQRPAGFVVLTADAEITEEDLRTELVALVRSSIGPVADFKDVHVVAALPKTRSGKILRKTMRQIADGEEYQVPSTIEDPQVIEDLIPVLRG